MSFLTTNVLFPGVLEYGMWKLLPFFSNENNLKKWWKLVGDYRSQSFKINKNGFPKNVKESD